MLNYLIAIDKPSGMTSHDVVAKLRGIFSQKRIGHAGTLDPFATGILVVGLGQATKLLECLSAENKVYEATFALGKETTTDDIEGEAIFKKPLSAQDKQRLVSFDFANEKLAEMKTWSQQIPPSFSAVSVEGTRSYKRARKESKEEVEASLSARPISIHKADLLGIEVSAAGEILWTVRVDVSKGTYVRALARDLGRLLGCGAYVKTLRREQSGGVGLTDCISLEALQKAKDGSTYPSVSSGVDDSEEENVSCGHNVAGAIGWLGRDKMPTDGNIFPARNALSSCLAEYGLNPYEVLKMPFRYVTELDLKKARIGDSLYNTDAIAAGNLIKPQPGEKVALFNEEGLWGLWKVKDQLSLICERNFPEPIAGVEVPYVF